MSFILHGITIAYAVTMLVLTARMMSSDKKSNVLLLIESELTLKPLLAALACFAALIPILWLVFSMELIPRGSPGHFATFLIAMMIGFVATLLLVTTNVMKRTSLGSLTFIDEATLRVQVVDVVKELTVSSVRITRTEGSQLATWAAYEVSDGQDTFHFFGQLPIPKWKNIEGDVQPPQGMLIAGSSQKLFDWVQPFTRR